MTKTLNQIFFFPPPKSDYFFQQHANQNIFLEKKHNPPSPSPFKLNGRSLNMQYLCNTNVVLDTNVILNIENICHSKFKEIWYYNDLMLNDIKKIRIYRLFKNEYGKTLNC